MSKFRWLFAAVGAALGIVATTLAHNVQAPDLPPRAVSGACDVPPSFGSLKGVWEDRLLFEDADGVLRAVDAACGVRLVIRRQ